MILSFKYKALENKRNSCFYMPMSWRGSVGYIPLRSTCITTSFRNEKQHLDFLQLMGCIIYGLHLNYPYRTQQ